MSGRHHKAKWRKVADFGRDDFNFFASLNSAKLVNFAAYFDSGYMAWDHLQFPDGHAV